MSKHLSYYYHHFAATGKVYLSCGFRKDTKAFLFTLLNTNGYYPEKLAVTNSQYAIYDCSSYHPMFGYDLRLYRRNMNAYVSCHSYSCANYPLASPHSFKPDEAEVFYEIAPPGTFLIPFSLITLFIRSCLNRAGVLMGITVITPERRKI